MKQLLYVGKFTPWTDSHDDELYEALQTFDEVKICVQDCENKKGQPSKILESELKDRIEIVYFNKLSDLLSEENSKYIMFER